MPGRMAGGDLHPYAGEDLLPVRNFTDARRQTGDLLGHALRRHQVALGPFRLGHEVVGMGEYRLVAARGGSPERPGEE